MAANRRWPRQHLQKLLIPNSFWLSFSPPNPSFFLFVFLFFSVFFSHPVLFAPLSVFCLQISRASPAWRPSAQPRSWSWPSMSCLLALTNWLGWVSGQCLARSTVTRLWLYGQWNPISFPVKRDSPNSDEWVISRATRPRPLAIIHCCLNC